jgi:hypothetical protein
MYKDGTCPSTVSAAGVVTRGPCPDAYGKVLGMCSQVPLLAIPDIHIILRNVVNMLLPRNIHVIHPYSHATTCFPAHRHR